MDHKAIAQDWLDDMAYTAALRDCEAHLDLFSRKVQLHGVPGAGVMDYDGWAGRRRHELNSRLLFSLTYRDLAIVSADEDRITFRVNETMKSTEGHVLVLQKEITLVREEKERWRATLERIEDHEMKHA